MASESTHLLEKLKSLSDPSCSAGASSDSEYVSSSASELTTTSSSATYFSASASNMEEAESGDGTSVEDAIERSKVHWSQLSEHFDSQEDESAEVSNVEVFKSLHRHPTWGGLFLPFGDGSQYDHGELEVGKKFAEGGQADLFHARVTWKYAESIADELEHGYRWVLKVFKKGTFLRDLRKQWPEGMFRNYEESRKRSKHEKSWSTRHACSFQCGTLLPDGRFAFLLVREAGDLRTLIDRKMKANTCPHCGPFSMEMAFQIMYHVAEGMDWLHNLNIVHRDLKASNVLYSIFNINHGIGYSFYVSDFECSIGVVGTGFFRAPEILQAVKDRVVSTREDLFTKGGDVYSYGMVCYEILTGKLPFEGHPQRGSVLRDLVLSGQRPEVPHHVDEWVQELLRRCWLSDPAIRPTCREILNFLETNAEVCRKLRRSREEREMMPPTLRENPKYYYED